MNNSLTGVERDIVIDNLRQNGSMLILRKENDTQKDSVALQPGMFSVLQEGILLVADRFSPDQLKFCARNRIPMTVHFFYRGRGLYFNARPQPIKTGIAFVIPPVIFKQISPDEYAAAEISATVFYSAKMRKGESLQCFADSDYPLFEPALWQHISEEEARNARSEFFQIADLVPAELPAFSGQRMNEQKKILYVPEEQLPQRNYFPYEATITDADIFASERGQLLSEFALLNTKMVIPFCENPLSPVHSLFCLTPEESQGSFGPTDVSQIVQLLPICRFLARNKAQPVSVESRISPLTILYIGPSEMILAGTHRTGLQRAGEYPFSLFMPLGNVRREIAATIVITQVYDNPHGAECYVCRIIHQKEEDRRFLYENLYRKKYGEY